MERPDDHQVGGDHYVRCSITPWEIVTRNELEYFEGNCLKYLLRHKRKGGRQDLLKMQHYLSYMIEHYDNLYLLPEERKFPPINADAVQELRRSAA